MRWRRNTKTPTSSNWTSAPKSNMLLLMSGIQEALASTVSDAQPEFIFHLAAQALVRRAYDDPKTTFDTNVGGAVNLLEATRAADTVRALVFVTSDKAYRNKEWTWGYRENDELGGQEPYGASKAAAELVFTAYHESFFRQRPDLGVVTTRAGNVIGGGDWALDRIIPDCIRALQAEEPVVLRNQAQPDRGNMFLTPCMVISIWARRWPTTLRGFPAPGILVRKSTPA